MSTLDKATLKLIREDIDSALQAVSAKHGLTSLQTGTCTFDTNGNFTFKVDGVVSGGLDRTASLYNNSRSLFGWPELGTKFKSGKAEYEIVGCNTTGSKIIGKTSDGKRYLFDADAVVKLCQK